MKKKLGNPAVATILSSEAGQKAINNVSDNQKKIVQATASTIPFLIKTVVVLGIGAFVWYKYANRFKSLNENPNYEQSNITESQAKTKAESIFSAMYGFGGNYSLVAQNLAGVNYNGFIRIYNAFGLRQGSIPFSSKMNLVQWFSDQFNEDELEQLRFLVGRNFF